MQWILHLRSLRVVWYDMFPSFLLWFERNWSAVFVSVSLKGELESSCSCRTASPTPPRTSIVITVGGPWFLTDDGDIYIQVRVARKL